MKKLIISVILTCFWTFLAMAQVATNKIVNTATIYSSNSPVILRGILNAESNVFVGGFITAGTNATTGAAVGTHSFANSNSGNPVLVLRNYSPTGNSSIYYRSSDGTDAGNIGAERNGSNLVIHAFLNALSYIRLTTQSGSAANELYVHPTVTTNAGPFWANSINSTNYMVNGVRGITLSITNVGIGVTNVEVFAEGLLTNKFTLP